MEGSGHECSCPVWLIPGERGLSTYWKGAWVGLRACLDISEKRKPLSVPGVEPQVIKPTAWSPNQNNLTVS